MFQVIDAGIAGTHVKEIFNLGEGLERKMFFPHLQKGVLHNVFRYVIVFHEMLGKRSYPKIIFFEYFLEHHLIAGMEPEYGIFS